MNRKAKKDATKLGAQSEVLPEDSKAADSKEREGPSWWVQTLILGLGSAIGLLGTLFYQWYIALPRLEGMIVFTTVGTSDDPRFSTKPTTGVSMFVTLANPKETPVSVTDYVLEVKTGEGWKRFKTVFRDLSDFRLGFSGGVFSPQDCYVRFPSNTNFLTFEMLRPIDRSQPRSGLLVFLSPDGIEESIQGEFRLNIFDAYGRTHILREDKKRKIDPDVLLRLAPGVTVESSQGK